MTHRPPARLARGVALLAAVAGLSACTPPLNWREVRVEGGAVIALLPCKPDEATRAQPIAGQARDLHLWGCEAAGGLYALAALRLPEAPAPTPAARATAPATVPGAREVQAAWERQWAERLQGARPEPLALTVKGADWSRAVQACGQAPDGRATCSASLWFARGAALYQAVVYAPRVSGEQREAFFGGIALP